MSFNDLKMLLTKSPALLFKCSTRRYVCVFLFCHMVPLKSFKPQDFLCFPRRNYVELLWCLFDDVVKGQGGSHFQGVSFYLTSLLGLSICSIQAHSSDRTNSQHEAEYNVSEQ